MSLQNTAKNARSSPAAYHKGSTPLTDSKRPVGGEHSHLLATDFLVHLAVRILPCKSQWEGNM